MGKTLSFYMNPAYNQVSPLARTVSRLGCENVDIMPVIRSCGYMRV